MPWVPPPFTHALACLLAHRPSLRSLHLGALPAPLRALPVPRPLPGSLPCVAPSLLAPLLLAARALARSLRVPLGSLVKDNRRARASAAYRKAVGLWLGGLDHNGVRTGNGGAGN